MTNTTTSQTTALQVINFNFYGDDLIALKDNATGEIYTSINSVLRGIGFSDKNQIRKRRDKWINDIVISKGICVFNIPTQEVVSKNGTTLFDEKETYCISQHKLPLALAKINITPSMKKKQPELASRLELYQDKCADVLASVFIDHKIPDQVSIQQYIQPMINAVTTLTKTINDTLHSMNDRISKLEELQQSTQPKQQPQIPKKRFSYWASKMFPKYQLLMDYFGISQYKDLYKQLYWELENTYPEIELNQIIDDYCYENHLDSCFTLDAIEHDKTVRKLFECIVDNLLKKYNLISESNTIKHTTIFDKTS